MKRIVLLSMMLAAAGAATAHLRRTTGYGGTLPVGVGSALAPTECADGSIVTGRPDRAMAITADCAQQLRSPDGRFLLMTRLYGDNVALSIVSAGGTQRLMVLEQPATILWSPASDAFFINDGEGSGQTSRLRTFRRTGRSWQASRALDRRASRLFLRWFDCGAQSYTNVSGVGWTRSGLIRAVVQEGVHSAGCTAPGKDAAMLTIVGGPATGRIHMVHGN